MLALVRVAVANAQVGVLPPLWGRSRGTRNAAAVNQQILRYQFPRKNIRGESIHVGLGQCLVGAITLMTRCSRVHVER